jgi:hypothetical protein
MKKTALLVLSSIALLTSALTAHPQPAQVWAVKLADSSLTNVVVIASGTDGSILADANISTTSRRFWINSSGQVVAELTDALSGYAAVVFVSSDQVLTRMNWPAWYTGTPPSGVVDGRLIHFSKVNGLVAKTTYDLPGTNADQGSEYNQYQFLGPLAFFTTSITNGATYLTKWRFDGLQPSATGSLSLRRTSKDSLTLTATTTSPEGATIDATDDLKTWRQLTNFTGQVEVPVGVTGRSEEFFRSR